ncbi:MAG: hypothetical protein ACR2KC_01745, partial [Acidimicrobiales bacterium]
MTGASGQTVAEASGPLAYLFWHAPAAGVRADDYVSGLRGFHAAVEADPPTGWIGSWSWRLPRPPWLGEWPPEVYSDWYLVEGFDALGELNSAAVGGSRRPAHDKVAGRSGWGTGALFKRCGAGRATLATPGEVVSLGFLDKAPGVAYAGAERELEAAGEASWVRQL